MNPLIVLNGMFRAANDTSDKFEVGLIFLTNNNGKIVDEVNAQVGIRPLTGNKHCLTGSAGWQFVATEQELAANGLDTELRPCQANPNAAAMALAVEH